MEKLSASFNAYDQIGYIIVGASSILLFYFNATYLYNEKNIIVFTLDNAIIWVVLAYFLGHLVQAISNLIGVIPGIKIIIPDSNHSFTISEKEILNNNVKTYFNLKYEDNDKQIWQICYMFSLMHDKTGQIQHFNCYYGLYRGWIVLFVMNFVFLLFHISPTMLSYNNLLPIIDLALIALFFLRAKRFWRYISRKVFAIYAIETISNTLIPKISSEDKLYTRIS